LHGNFGGIDCILAKSKYDPAADQVIFVGDYIDGSLGEDFSVKKTINNIIKLQDENKNIIKLIGNHDWWMLDWIQQKNVEPLSVWYNQGGKATLLSYDIKGRQIELLFNKVKHQILKSHVEFLEGLWPSYYDDEVVVVHGGFINSHDMLGVYENAPLEEFSLKYPISSTTMYQSTGYNSEYPIYNILWDRDFYRTSVKSLLDCYKDIFGDRIFICGHTPRGPILYTEKGVKRYLIDGGSKGGGLLNALIIKDGHCTLIKED